MHIQFFQTREREPAPVPCDLDPVTASLLHYAHYVCSTDDLLFFLSSITGMDARETIDAARCGLFTSYLTQLDRGQFNTESWSKGLSALFGETLEFDTVRQAKNWLHQHKDDFRTDE